MPLAARRVGNYLPARRIARLVIPSALSDVDVPVARAGYLKRCLSKRGIRTMSKNRYATRKSTNDGRAETLRRREIRRFKYQGAPLLGKAER